MFRNFAFGLSVFGFLGLCMLIGYFFADSIDRWTMPLLPGMDVESEHIDMVKPCLDELPLL